MTGGIPKAKAEKALIAKNAQGGNPSKTLMNRPQEYSVKFTLKDPDSTVKEREREKDLLTDTSIMYTAPFFSHYHSLSHSLMQLCSSFFVPFNYNVKSPAISVFDVSFGFSADNLLFEDLHFGIDCHSRIAVVGPNGSVCLHVSMSLFISIPPPTSQIPPLSLFQFSDL